MRVVTRTFSTSLRAVRSKSHRASSFRSPPPAHVAAALASDRARWRRWWRQRRQRQLINALLVGRGAGASSCSSLRARTLDGARRRDVGALALARARAARRGRRAAANAAHVRRRRAAAVRSGRGTRAAAAAVARDSRPTVPHRALTRLLRHPRRGRVRARRCARRADGAAAAHGARARKATPARPTRLRGCCSPCWWRLGRERGRWEQGQRRRRQELEQRLEQRLASPCLASPRLASPRLDSTQLGSAVDGSRSSTSIVDRRSVGRHPPPSRHRHLSAPPLRRSTTASPPPRRLLVLSSSLPGHHSRPLSQLTTHARERLRHPPRPPVRLDDGALRTRGSRHPFLATPLPHTKLRVLALTTSTLATTNDRARSTKRHRRC